MIAIVTNNKIIRAARFSSGLFSILAHGEVCESEDLAFEIIDHENITYWVQEILTPQQAIELLQEHGLRYSRGKKTSPRGRLYHPQTQTRVVVLYLQAV